MADLTTDLWQQSVALVWDWRFAVAVACTIVAGLMRGYSGFGTAILLAPVYSTLWSPRTGVPVVLLMELFVSAYLLPRAMATANARLIGPICAAAVLAMPFGSVVLLQADGATLRRVIGAFVLVFGLLMSSSWRYHGTRPLGLNIAVGLVSGLLKGATGMAGPPVILYLLAGKEAAAQHRANLILFFGVLGVAAIVPPLWAGLMDIPALLMTALMLPVMLVSVPIGARLFHVVPLHWYRRLALGLLVGVGLFALLG